MLIAIQGIRGSFHEIAAFKYFGEREEINTVECHSFHQLFQVLEDEEATYGVMAIENTVAGTILPNYALLRNSDLKIIGEVYLRIQHNLLVVNGQPIEQLTEVRSHPMAILQCQDFFRDHKHIKLISTQDTALSAKEIADNHTKGIGAIASSLAADHYKLNILAEGIETNKRNFTRFLILAPSKLVKPSKHSNKASICFHLKHKSGSLASVLSLLAKRNLNLTKIQSLPIVGQVWEYFFHIDLEFEDFENYKSTLVQLEEYVEEFEILGEYKTGIKHRTI